MQEYRHIQPELEVRVMQVQSFDICMTVTNALASNLVNFQSIQGIWQDKVMHKVDGYLLKFS